MILRYFSRREWALSVLIVALVAVQVFLDLEIPGCMSNITVALEHGDDATVIEEGKRMLYCALVSVVCALANNYLCSRVAVNVATRVRELQYHNVLRFSRTDVDGFSAASLITRSTNDVYQVQQFIGRGIHIVIHAPILAVWAILKILGKDWHWTLATAVTVVIIMVLMYLVMRYTVSRFRKIQGLIDDVNTSVRDNIKGVRVIRAHNAEGHENERFEKANNALQRNSLEVAGAMAFMFPIVSALMNFLTMAIYVIGAYLITATGNVEEQIVLFGDMIVFSSYAMQIISAFMLFSAIFRMMPRASVAIRRIEEVIDHEPSIPDGGTEEPEGASIEFRHVSFSYPGSEGRVVDDVSFSVGPGETLAIIGPTGCGKSTLLGLMMRFYEADEGAILIGGKDIRECTQSSIRGMIGYAPQQAILFNGSVRDNVNYGQGSSKRTDEDVLHALEVAQARSFVEALPEGLDSNISQYGRNLSGGQKQRICIARAVCRHPKVFLLDDCFSALDYITDSRLREALAKESEDSIRVIVAQRIGTIKDADRILVLEEGKVVGIGTHDELMRGCPEYRDIAESQITGGVS